MMKDIKNPCFIYTLLWCVYWCQGILYQSGGVVSQSVALLILVISLIYTCKYLLSNRIAGYTKALLFVLLLVSVYGGVAYITDGDTIRGLEDDTRLFAWFKNMYLSILPIFTYLCFVKEGYLEVGLVKKMMPLIIISLVCSYYWSLTVAIQQAILKTGDEVNEVTNNAGYSVISLIPVLLLYDQKNVGQYIGLFLIVALVVLSMKRGAILLCGIMSFCFVLRSFRHASVQKKLLIILLLVILFVLGYYLIEYLLSESDFLMKRIEDTKEGKTSGRNEIYKVLLVSFLNQTNPWMVLFGGGVWYTTKLTWTAAHNDWLEFLIDMGVFGVVVYINYWISFCRLYINKRRPDLSRFCIFLIFIKLFIKTLYSMSLDTMTFIDGMMLALSYYGLLNSKKLIR